MGMLDIEVGKVVFIKTTKEPVFVLELEKNGDAKVKRPVSTDSNGVVHNLEFFGIGELETEHSKILDEIAIRKFAMEQNQLAADEHRNDKNTATAQVAKEPLPN